MEVELLQRVSTTFMFYKVALGAVSNSKDGSVSHLTIHMEANANTIVCSHVYFLELIFNLFQLKSTTCYLPADCIYLKADGHSMEKHLQTHGFCRVLSQVWHKLRIVPAV